MNVQMRIITEENVDQLLNLSYQSQNIDKLLGIDHGEDGTVNREIREIIENHKKNTMSKIKADNAPVLVKENQYGREMPQNLEQGEQGEEEGEESSPEYAKQFSQRPGPPLGYEGEGLGTGAAKDFAEYQNMCGKIRGLLTAQMELNDLKKNLENSDE